MGLPLAGAPVWRDNPRMDEEEIAKLTEAQGLGAAVARFPDEIRDAIALALQQRDTLSKCLLAETDEP